VRKNQLAAVIEESGFLRRVQVERFKCSWASWPGGGVEALRPDRRCASSGLFHPQSTPSLRAGRVPTSSPPMTAIWKNIFLSKCRSHRDDVPSPTHEERKVQKCKAERETEFTKRKGSTVRGTVSWGQTLDGPGLLKRVGEEGGLGLAMACDQKCHKPMCPDLKIGKRRRATLVTERNRKDVP